MIGTCDALLNTHQLMQSLGNTIDKLTALVIDLNMNIAMATYEGVQKVCNGVSCLIDNNYIV